MTTERTGGPGPRKEIGTEANNQVHPPHVTENDRGAQVQGSSSAPNEVPALPANASGQDKTRADKQVTEIDDESMYGSRPAEDKDWNPRTDTP